LWQLILVLNRELINVINVVGIRDRNWNRF